MSGLVPDVVVFIQRIQRILRREGLLSAYLGYVCVPHVTKGTTHRDGNLLGKWSIILILELVSIPPSCPSSHSRSL
jgi:hypothetical protein